MHFLVMVFGDNMVQQLAPFQQTNMGPIDPKYMKKLDYTDEVHEQFQASWKCIRLSDGRGNRRLSQCRVIATKRKRATSTGREWLPRPARRLAPNGM
jgi:hypothetical protein